VDSGYTTPQTITAQDNIVYIKVFIYAAYSIGSFALKVSEITPEPVLTLKINNTNIPNGGSCEFGNGTVCSSKSVAFTVQNTGNLSLNLTGTPPVQLSGAGASYFSVTAQLNSLVTANGSTTFTVKFTPTDPGTQTATVSIPSNDPDYNPYTFTITGTGGMDTLPFGVWTRGNITIAGEVKTYCFTATPGKTYTIAWDDSYQGSGTYTLDVKVSANRQDQVTTYFSNIDSGYNSPRTITAQDGMVYIKVVSYYSGGTGSFGIKVTQVN
jgi:hypothetical protein